METRALKKTLTSPCNSAMDAPLRILGGFIGGEVQGVGVRV